MIDYIERPKSHIDFFINVFISVEHTSCENVENTYYKMLGFCDNDKDMINDLYRAIDNRLKNKCYDDDIYDIDIYDIYVDLYRLVKTELGISNYGRCEYYKSSERSTQCYAIKTQPNIVSKLNLKPFAIDIDASKIINNFNHKYGGYVKECHNLFCTPYDFPNRREIINWIKNNVCNNNGIMVIDDDGIINCIDYYKTKNLKWTVTLKNDCALPNYIQFGKVEGDFTFKRDKFNTNSIKTLKGCPKQVDGNFNCSNLNLESLEYCPEYVGGNFIAKQNDLSTTFGFNSNVNIEGLFDVSSNKMLNNDAIDEIEKKSYPYDISCNSSNFKKTQIVR